MDELIYASATSLARAIREKQVSSFEVVEAFLHRIEAVNPQLNAVVQLNAEPALTQAKQADLALARGEIIGLLHGVPITVKDSFDTEGIISTAGTKGRTSYIPQQDATAVARMRQQEQSCWERPIFQNYLSHMNLTISSTDEQTIPMIFHARLEVVVVENPLLLQRVDRRLVWVLMGLVAFACLLISAVSRVLNQHQGVYLSQDCCLMALEHPLSYAMSVPWPDMWKI